VRGTACRRYRENGQAAQRADHPPVDRFE